jgi:hypothetical protein
MGEHHADSSAFGLLGKTTPLIPESIWPSNSISLRAGDVIRNHQFLDWMQSSITWQGSSSEFLKEGSAKVLLHTLDG